jgi:integrase
MVRGFHAALRRAGVPACRFHDLRHTAATIMLEQGVDLLALSRVLGHADVGTTANIYGHLTRAMQQTAADRMDGALARTS